MPADRASLSTRLSAGASSTLGTRSSGRIVRLEMYNFKSYSGRRVVGFDLVEVCPGPNPKEPEWDACVGARALYKLCGCATASLKD